MRKIYLLTFALLFSIIFISMVSATPITESAPNYPTTTASSAKLGVEISTNKQLTLINATVGASCSGLTQVYLYDSSGNLMSNVTLVGTLATWSGLQNRTLLIGKHYNLTADAEGAAYTGCKLDPAVTPYNYTNIAYLGDNAGDPAVLRNVQTITTDSSATGEITVSLDYPPNGFSTNILSSYFNTTLAPTFMNTTNATLYIWYNMNDTIFNTSYSNVIGSSTNKTGWNVTLDAQNYKWNVYGCGINTTAVSNCFWAASNYTLTVGAIVNSNSSNLTTYESSYESFRLNMTTLPGLNVSSAALIYNGTTYTGATVSSDGTNYIITRAIDIPFGAGLKNWYYQITYTDSSTSNLATTSQAVSAANFTLCGLTGSTSPYLNISFKNETVSKEAVKGSITSTWVYWLGSGAVNASYTFNNVSENFAYNFCGLPTNRTINTIGTVNYYNSESVQRTFNGLFTLTNSTNATSLYLLPTSTGIYVSFQVIDVASNPITGVTVAISRSGYGLLETRTTDGSGIATFFLDPTATYSITASKTGYSTFSDSITPTQASYTINLGAGTLTSAFPTGTNYQGINYIIKPTEETLLNQTIYDFNLTLTSDYSTVTEFGFTLYDSQGNNVGSASASSNGGTVSYSLNTGTNATIRMTYYWIIAGNSTYGSKTWFINDDTKTGYSINNLKNRLIYYVNNGSIFGLTPVSLNIIIFIIILITTGIFAFTFGFDRPILIVGLMLALVFFFDGVLGFITYTSPIPDKAATIVMAFIFVGMLVREMI